MKILQLCHKPPFPPIDGGAIAMNNISQGILKAGHELKIISIETDKHPVIKEELPSDYIEKTQFESVFLDTRISIEAAFKNLFSSRSYNVERFISETLEQCIIKNLQKEDFDIIILEGLFVAPYFKTISKNSKAKIVLRSHNIEYLIWERMSQNSKNPIKKVYLSLLSRRLKNFEIKSLKRVDGICAMTEIDSEIIKSIAPDQKVKTIPSGYIIQELTTEQKNIKIEKNSIFHIASMNWQPNVEAINWFLWEVWPNILLRKNQAQLYLAGREMPSDIKKLKTKGVNIIGEVKNAKDFYLSKEIMIVPLLSGSGMRIKIIEGMALGKVIISTSIGAEGIVCEHNKNILIADSPSDFTNCVLQVLQDENFKSKISENAKELIARHYNNDVVCNDMLNFFKELS